MRLVSPFLLAFFAFGLAVPLEERVLPASGMAVALASDDTPTPLDGPAASSPTPAAPTSGASSGTIPVNSGASSSGGLAGSLGGLGGFLAILQGLLPFARDESHIPAPLIKRMDDLAIDIRAELEARSHNAELVEKRQLSSLPIGQVLNQGQLGQLSAITGDPTSALSTLPISALVPGSSNALPVTPGQLTQIVAGTPAEFLLALAGILPLSALGGGTLA